MWRSVVVERVPQWGEPALQPPLVQDQPVRIGNLYRVEGDVEPSPQRVVLAQQAAEELEGEGADRFVRMRYPEEEHGCRPVADGEKLDWPSLAGCPHRLQPCQRRELAHQGARTRLELLEGQELVQIGHPGEEPGQVESGIDDGSLRGRAGPTPHQDSSFDE